MDSENIFRDKPKRVRRAIAVVAGIGLLFAGLEILIVRSYVESSRLTDVFTTSVNSTTFLANVQREFFLYQDELLHTPVERWDARRLVQRRTFLTRQVDLLARAGRSEEFESRVDAVRYKLSSINGLVRDPSLVRGGEAAVKMEIRRRLGRLALQLKRAFDAEETLLYGTVSQAVRSREKSQRFLIALAGLVFIVAALVTGGWSRSVRSRLSTAYKALLTEIDERKALQDRLAHQAFHDGLTGLANRDLFHNDLDKALERAARRATSVAVLYLDLDNFKSVNDTFGHEAGDELLKQVGDRLKRCIRASDTAARLGGDEFAAVVDDMAARADVVALAGRIVEELDAIPQLDATLPIRASIGIALSDETTTTADRLLKNADYAMYEAKVAGKNGYRVYDEDMAARATDAVVLEQELREAIPRGELVLHYQPLVSLPSQAPAGLEALVRWNHPTRGFLAPGAFVPVAEERGLIVLLDRWVLNEACRQLAAWKKKRSGFESLYVSVNISAAHFEDATLVEDVAGALAGSGLDPRYLRLEVTESTLMRDKDSAAETLDRLKRLGVSISLDDFGTGYSSFGYLRRFSLDTLKVDRSFVANVATKPEDAAVAEAIVKLAHTLDLEVVAEGVENEAQLAELTRMGCETGQGFLFSRPQPPEVVESMIGSPPSRSRVLTAFRTASAQTQSASGSRFAR